MNEMWRYVVTPHASRDLRRLDPSLRRRIFEAIDRLVANEGRGDVRKLAGSIDEYQLRVGHWSLRYRAPIVVELANRAGNWGHWGP